MKKVFTTILTAAFLTFIAIDITSCGVDSSDKDTTTQDSIAKLDSITKADSIAKLSVDSTKTDTTKVKEKK